MIKSYRGKLPDGGQHTLNLHTNDGKTGYKLVKFQVIPALPGTAAGEHTVQIFKVKQTTVPTGTAVIDFTDNTLLGAAIIGNSTNITNAGGGDIIVFDNEIFNQDIYVTHTEANSDGECNYYIELEQISLTEDQALVAIVKNLRNEQ